MKIFLVISELLCEIKIPWYFCHILLISKLVISLFSCLTCKWHLRRNYILFSEYFRRFRNEVRQISPSGHRLPPLTTDDCPPFQGQRRDGMYNRIVSRLIYKIINTCFVLRLPTFSTCSLVQIVPPSPSWAQYQSMEYVKSVPFFPPNSSNTLHWISECSPNYA